MMSVSLSHIYVVCVFVYVCVGGGRGYYKSVSYSTSLEMGMFTNGLFIGQYFVGLQANGDLLIWSVGNYKKVISTPLVDLSSGMICSAGQYGM